MKAISLWQPWASLIACGAKPYETRSWAPPIDLIGRTIAIHAAKKIDKEAARFAEEICYGQHGHGLDDRLEASWGGDLTSDRLMGRFGNTIMPIGCVVCTATLKGAFQLGETLGGKIASVIRVRSDLPMPRGGFAVEVDEFGDYAAGRWAWLLSDVKPTIPLSPARGAQGFFELPQGCPA